MTEDVQEQEPAAPQAVIHIAPGPHASMTALTTRRMMIDVLIALTPVTTAALIVFGWYAVVQLVICVVSCAAAEALLTSGRRRPFSLGDCSAIVTGVILGLSLPGIAPWYVGAIGGFAAIGLGKFIFGGLGYNIFNPAMVGRAFVMIAFTAVMAAPAYVKTDSNVQAITRATPMTALQMDNEVAPLWTLAVGNTNGSLGETSAIACLLGGLYLLIRRTAAWQIPVAMLATAGVVALLTTRTSSMAMISLLVGGHWAALGDLLREQWTLLHHLAGGALLFGALFIATDPVTSPLTPKGRWIFGAGVGLLVMLLRTLSAYPEGVMFAVLLMNALVPLINRSTIPRPVGGPVPRPQEKK